LPARSILLCTLLLLSLACASTAAAQGPAYVPQPPSRQVLYQDGQTDRYLLGGSWLYRADPSDGGLAEGWWQDQASTEGWIPVTVPNSYNAGDFSSQSYDGYVGWYRRDFTLPAGAFPRYVPMAARHWVARFESAVYHATVWLNGREAGSHAGGYLPWELDLGGLRPGVNRLIVRVDNRTGPADLPPGPGSAWWNFGGLQREVYLRAVARADLQQVLIKPLLTCAAACAATIQEQATVRNVTGSPQTVGLYGSYGSARLDFGRARLAPHAIWIARASVMIRHPRLWAPGSPTLYRATLTLTDAAGRPLGGYLDYSGIRSIVVKHGRLELNGRPLDLRGVDLQEQNIASGAALTPAQTAQQLGWVRQLGATVIRAHYPVGPLMEELADREGILIWSEIPVWGVQNQYFSQPAWLGQARELLRENILDNQNHPSILLWSIANEPPQPPTSPEAAYIRGAVALVHSLDPTRPAGMAIMGVPGIVCDPAYAPLQVIGANEYFGLFDEGGGVTDDRDALGPFLDSFRACHPNQALMVTEFGFDGNRNGPVEEYGTYQFQANMLAYHLAVFASKRWLSGAVLQTLQDFVASPGYNGANPWPDSPFNQKGLLDLYGNEKPAFAVVSSSYHSTQQIGPSATG
jgi:Glycosyl hydrolases family 2, TIM barrel domain/Glycosyl hydrolases family 2, sugar binding domain/Glycosyl hydrolases family 2